MKDKLTKFDIELDKNVMSVSKYFEERISEHPEYVCDYVPNEHLEFYIPDGYEGWELKTYNSETISKVQLLISPNKEVVLAPYQHGFAREFLNDMIEIYL